MDKALKYEDICLEPKYSTCESRSDASTLTMFGPKQFHIPVVPSNMKAVVLSRRVFKY